MDLICGGKTFHASHLPPYSSVSWLLYAQEQGLGHNLCGIQELGSVCFSLDTFSSFICLSVCQEGGEPIPSCMTCTPWEGTQTPINGGEIESDNLGHGEPGRSSRISGPQSKTETFFGHESPHFSNILRESMTQDGFPNQLNVWIPLNRDFLLLVTQLKAAAWHLIASFTACCKVLCVAVEFKIAHGLESL